MQWSAGKHQCVKTTSKFATRLRCAQHGANARRRQSPVCSAPAASMDHLLRLAHQSFPRPIVEASVAIPVMTRSAAALITSALTLLSPPIRNCTRTPIREVSRLQPTMLHRLQYLTRTTRFLGALTTSITRPAMAYTTISPSTRLITGILALGRLFYFCPTCEETRTNCAVSRGLVANNDSAAFWL
jgi:hypothetical protein